MSEQAAAPIGLLAELTHRCPLRCPYCSNPVELEPRSRELDAASWARVFDQAAELGVLQVHLSGGEPAARHDLTEIVRAASLGGLYTNLITSGIGLTAARLATLRQAGLDHVQLSLQDSCAEHADRIAGYEGAHARKLALARETVAAGLALTINVVLHRSNIGRTSELVALAAGLGAGRIELAHAQYHGWALRNRAGLMPTSAQVQAWCDALAELRAQYADQLAIDAVSPDYHASRPKPCMGGWGRRLMVVTPTGLALPCHAAQTIPGLEFWSVREHGLKEIWSDSPAFEAFRGTHWMSDPCRSCPARELDFGGCRCQALALTGDARAADPVCTMSPWHKVVEQARAAGERGAPTQRSLPSTRTDA